MRINSAIEVVIDKDLEDLIPDYLKNRQQEYLQLKDALESKDFVMIQSLGHKLRGSAGSYGFDTLSEVGEALEENAKVGNRLKIEKALEIYQLYLRNVRISYR